MKNFLKIVASLFLVGIMTSCSLNDDSDVNPAIDNVANEDSTPDGGTGGQGSGGTPPPNGG